MEIKRGERFKFGENWKQFLSTLNESRIKEAENSLQQMLEIGDLSGKTFLDIGCGSGLFSLAARRLGAEVHSFDYDPQSVVCAQELKRLYFPDDKSWIIEEGSALDDHYLRSLGQFDIVYSWGVLHHTGDMMAALENVKVPVKENGFLFIAIYNDQDFISTFWSIVKKAYSASSIGKCGIIALFFPLFVMQSLVAGLIKHGNPLGHIMYYKNKRGMSAYHDWIDWLGGYPFEVAKPEKIFSFYRNAGFRMTNLITTNRLGCNQFVFQKVGKATA